MPKVTMHVFLWANSHVVENMMLKFVRAKFGSGWCVLYGKQLHSTFHYLDVVEGAKYAYRKHAQFALNRQG